MNRRQTWIALAAGLLVMTVTAGCFDFNAFMQELLPPPMTPEVLETRSKDPDFRRDTINKVSRMPQGQREPWLKAYSILLDRDGDPTVRGACARALGKARATAYVPDLAKALSDPSPMVRWDAAAALDNVPGPAAAAPLSLHAVQDSSANVRGACARALRHYRRPEVVRTLATCLEDDDFAVRYQAHGSLVEITGQDRGFGPDDWKPLAADGATLPERPSRRPWWDWLGVTR